jgi:hypothetical protein
MNIKNKNNLMSDLVSNQLKNIPSDKKLSYSDLIRICKYLDNSIFEKKCTLWNGYVTSIKHDDKNVYINFYFNGKKYALHRLLYINFVGELADSEYIKFKCANKGRCCNINHIYKINKTDNIVSPILEPEKPDIKEPVINIVVDFNL